jgi:hypothetical protein
VQGCTLTQVGVYHYPRQAGEQSGASVKVVLRAFREIIRLWWRMRTYSPPSGEVVEPPPTWRGFVLFGSAAAMGLLFLRGLFRLFRK